MPLSTTNFHTRGPVKSLDMMQFVNLFTGVMNDQPVTFRNSVSIGGDQSNITVPLKIYGAPTQTTNLIDLYPDRTSPQPGFGFSAKGAFAWGPGGTAPQDTFLSRIASQNGHAGDTAGLLLNPRLEITAGLQVGSGLTVLGGGVNIVGGATISGNLGLTGSATISGALSVGTTSSFTGHMDINMQPPALSNGAYADGHLQLMAGGALNPRIGFHQTGSTALALYKETAQERLRIKGAGGNDWGIWTNETRTDMDLNARYLSTSDGSNGIVSARNGSLYIRSSGANYNAIFDTGSGGVLIQSGPLSVSGTVTCAGLLSSGPIAQNQGQLHYFNGNGNSPYMYWDGGYITFAGGAIQINPGSTNMLVGQYAQFKVTQAPNAGFAMQINGTNISTGAGKSQGLHINAGYAAADSGMICWMTDQSGNSSMYWRGDRYIWANRAIDQSSSREIKQNITTIQGALGVVKQMNGVSFVYTEAYDPNDREPHYGFVAEEMAEVLPAIVRPGTSVEREDGSVETLPASIAYTEIIPYLAEAIKELAAKVDALQPA